MSSFSPTPDSNTDRPDANYRPEGYYDATEPPLRTLVLRRIRRIASAIRPSRGT